MVARPSRKNRDEQALAEKRAAKQSRVRVRKITGPRARNNNRTHPSQPIRPPEPSPIEFDLLWDRAMDALARARAYHGSHAALDALCGYHSGSRNWSVVPPFFAVRTAAKCGYEITPHELRPDIYPYPEDAIPRHLRGWILRRHAERARLAEAALSTYHLAPIAAPDATDIPGATDTLTFGALTIRRDLLLGV